MKDWVVLVVIVVFLYLVFVRAAKAEKPDDKLFQAIAEVESNNTPSAVNGDAVGVLQIRPILVRDVNRILHREKYVLSDRYNVGKSREMFDVFLIYYAREVLIREGKPVSYENLARLWYGGPTQYVRESAFRYWLKVKEAMERHEQNIK